MSLNDLIQVPVPVFCCKMQSNPSTWSQNQRPCAEDRIGAKPKRTLQVPPELRATAEWGTDFYLAIALIQICNYFIRLRISYNGITNYIFD